MTIVLADDAELPVWASMESKAGYWRVREHEVRVGERVCEVLKAFQAAKCVLIDIGDEECLFNEG